ncbi:MAG: DUF11 domain-containing protein [Chloroflexi bacterium]|nr:DUF11 domain-containing protein [Chloroflexota bacterium]MBU1662521.1 DUF11 domain-containing protein [Chloroflexota bacterium]
MKPKILLFMICVLAFLSLGFVSQTSTQVQSLPPRPTPILPPKQTETENDVPELSLLIWANRDHADVGDVIWFTITLSNPDNVIGRSVKVLGLIPEILDVEKMTTTQGIINFNPDTHRVIVYNISPLHPKTSITISIQARVNAQAADGMKYYTAAKVEHGGRPNPTGLFSNWIRLDISKE